jgi:hypothetical protein
MPSNGTAVKLPLELDPSPLPNPTELEIGEAAAAAAVAIGRAVADFAMDGQLTDAPRTAGGESLARVAMLQLTHPGNDAEFATIAYREGKRALWRHHGFREHANSLDPAMREHMFEEFLQGAIEIAARTVADERALAQH